MRVIYRGVDMGVLETHLFDCRAVYADGGVDYLYTKVTLLVRAIVNGQVEVLFTNTVPPPTNPIKGLTQILQPKGNLIEIGGGVRKVDLPPIVRTTAEASGSALARLGGELTGGPVRPFNGPPISYSFLDKPPENVRDRTFVNPRLDAPPSAAYDIARGFNARPSTIPVDAVRAVNPFFAPLAIDSPNRGLTEAGIGIGNQPAGEWRQIQRVANAPPLTHQTIRHRLLTPHGQLYVFSGPGQESGLPDAGSNRPPRGLLLLEAPAQGSRVDCKNGPQPTSLSVYECLGDANTFLVDWACECYINEGPLNRVSQAGMLLSNRFKQTHEIDDSGYTTLSTAGEAVFRTDAVYDFGESPDAFRSVLFMPIPQGFVREDIQVTGRSDVTGVDYAYRDRQVPVNFVAGPYAKAAKISAVHRQALQSHMDLFGGALAAYERGQNFITQRRWAKSMKLDNRIKELEILEREKRLRDGK